MTRKLTDDVYTSWPAKLDEDGEPEYVPYSEYVRAVPEDDTFHIGQRYTGVAAETIACKACGGRQFEVGRGEYYTAIRCPKCEWEVCIHEG